MTRMSFFVALCLTTAGCAVFPGFPSTQNIVMHLLTRPDITPAQVAALPLGSKVQVICGSAESIEWIHGTVLHASEDGVALLNCVKSGRQKWPTATRRLDKHTDKDKHKVPVLWVSIQEITTAKVISPPSPDYVSPQLEIDTSNGVAVDRIGVDNPNVDASK